MALYPPSSAERDRFILSRRPPRAAPNPWRYQNLIVEDERTADGQVAPVATVFLTGRECPWRCAMCDLWQHTTEEDTPRGAIASQVAAATHVLRKRPDRVARMKLYNAGSFFDPRAVPDDDYDGVAAALSGFTHAVVESHPALVGPRVDRFLQALDRHGVGGRATELEVALGLETAHVEALRNLHKRMTVDDFARAADALRKRRVALRVFLLVFPPFVPFDEQDEWLGRSIDVAFACGAGVVSLVPTRSGNGTLETLASEGLFRAPALADVERSADVAFAHAKARGRVFVDLWDLGRFAVCSGCLDARHARLHTMNVEQRRLPPVSCPRCDEAPA